MEMAWEAKETSANVNGTTSVCFFKDVGEENVSSGKLEAREPQRWGGLLEVRGSCDAIAGSNVPMDPCIARINIMTDLHHHDRLVV